MCCVPGLVQCQVRETERAKISSVLQLCNIVHRFVHCLFDVYVCVLVSRVLLIACFWIHACTYYIPSPGEHKILRPTEDPFQRLTPLQFDLEYFILLCKVYILFCTSMYVLCVCL